MTGVFSALVLIFTCIGRLQHHGHYEKRPYLHLLQSGFDTQIVLLYVAGTSYYELFSLMHHNSKLNCSIVGIKRKKTNAVDEFTEIASRQECLLKRSYWHCC